MSLLHVYACGGTGINIAAALTKFESKPGYADLKVTYCDTSDSDLNHLKPNPSSVFLVDGCDGSGKVKKENYDKIKDSIPALLVRHEPGDINVIVFSGSGGSGSMFGPLIMSELMAEETPCIAVMIATSESKVSVNNTLSTIKSLDGISEKRRVPMVASFFSNETTVDTKVDEGVRNLIRALAVLYSGTNRSLDSKDLLHWVRFDKAIDAHPAVAMLRVVTGTELREKGVLDPVSVASLYKTTDSTPFQDKPDYSCYGYPASDKTIPDDLHFVISYSSVDVVASVIKETQTKVSAASVSRSKLANVRSKSDSTDDNGMCF